MESPEPFNPYAPPRAAIDSPVEDVRLDAELATRWQRLGGSLFDFLLQTIANLPGYVGVSSLAALAQKNAQVKNPFFLYTNAGRWGIVAALASAGLLALQWSLLVKRGQTIGKIVARTRIVRVDGTRAGVANVLFLRAWPVWGLEVLSRMTGAFALLGLADDLLVFRGDRRCLHDLLAGTKVVRVPNAW